MQLIQSMNQIFKRRNLKLKLTPYEILATGPDCGLIEFVADTLSIDAIRKKMSVRFNKTCDLYDYFRKNFGDVKSHEFIQAQKNFADSLAAYSLVCYVLQIKDRHNANILLTKDGQIVHIDYGFMLTTAPGRGIQIENAPFKLTKEFV